MNRRKQFAIAAIVGLFVLGLVTVAFLRLEFRMARSQSNTQHTLSTSTISQPDQGIVQANGLLVTVTGAQHDVLCTALRQSLVEQLQAAMAADQVVVAEADILQTNRPLLRVEVSARRIQWTPFWASADLTVEIVYASDGDIRWRDDATSAMRSGDPTVHSRGTAHIVDHTQGLISRSAYQKHLGQQAATEIYRMMEQPLFDPPG